MKVQIREIPAQDRPRERLQAHGARVLSASELLAVILGTGSKGESALEMAQRLLTKRQYSLRRLSSEPVSITSAHGVGKVRALRIHAALELGRRMASEELSARLSLKGPSDIFHVYSRLQDLPREEFHLAILNTQHCLEQDIKIAEGTLNTTSIHPREAFRLAIAENAAAVIFVHNHPSGDPRPSPEDIMITASLVESGKILGIEVVDHVIIGKGRYMSMKEYGAL